MQWLGGAANQSDSMWSQVRYSGDDSFAMWSVGAGQTNITFRNNRALNPHQGGGPRCAASLTCDNTTCAGPPRGCRPSGCFANYGGQASAFEGNAGAGCYQDAVAVIFGIVHGGGLLRQGRGTQAAPHVCRGRRGSGAR